MSYTTILSDTILNSTSLQTPINNKTLLEQPVGILEPIPVAYSVNIYNSLITSTTCNLSVNVVQNPNHTPFKGNQLVPYTIIYSTSLPCLTESGVPVAVSQSFAFISYPYNVIAVELALTENVSVIGGRVLSYLTVY